MNKLLIVPVLAACMSFSSCSEKKSTVSGKACLGSDNDTLVERIKDQCKAGDIVATKNPAYFCDFNYSVSYNDYNSAFCVYIGEQRKERTAK